MDILDFINSINDSNKPVTKKKKKTNTVTTVENKQLANNIIENNPSYVNMAISDEKRKWSVDAKIADKYRAYGINYNPWENLDKDLAEQQGFFTKAGNSLAQAIVSEVGLGTLKGFSDLVDLVGQAT